MPTVYQASTTNSKASVAPRATRRYPVSVMQVFRGIAGNPLPQQSMGEPDQQPRTARKYRKRPGGDAGPEITNGLGAFLCAARSKCGFGRASLLVAALPLRLHLERPHVAHGAARTWLGAPVLVHLAHVCGNHVDGDGAPASFDLVAQRQWVLDRWHRLLHC